MRSRITFRTIWLICIITCGGHPRSIVYTKRISLKAARGGWQEVHGAVGAAHKEEGVVEPAAAVHEAEDDDDVHRLRADAGW